MFELILLILLSSLIMIIFHLTKLFFKYPFKFIVIALGLGFIFREEDCDL